MNPEWAFSLGDSGTAYPGNRGLFVLPAGGGDIISFGSFAKSVDFDPTVGLAELKAYDSDWFIARYTSQSLLKWVKQFNGSINPTRPKTDAAGNIFIGTHFTTNLAFDTGIVNPPISLNAMPGYNGIVLKLDSSGHLVWLKEFAGLTDVAVTGVEIDPDGNAYVYGVFADSADADPGPGIHMLYETPSNINGEMFLVKLDQNGEFVWAKMISGKRVELPISSIIDTNSSSIIISGLFIDTVDFDPGIGQNILISQGYNPNPQLSPYDIFILKIDTAGIFSWAKQLGPVNSTPLLKLDQNGDYYFGCNFIGQIVVDPNGSSDTIPGTRPGILFSHWMKNGDLEWTQSIYTNQPLLYDFRSLNSISCNQQNELIYTGYFIDSLFYEPGNLQSIFTTKDYHPDIFIGSLSASGLYNWCLQIGDYHEQTAEDLLVDESGAVYITGTHMDTCDYDPGAGIFDVKATDNSTSILIAKYNTFPLPVQEVQPRTEIVYYPNPTEGLFEISSPSGALLKIFDVSGKLLMSDTIQIGNNSIDIRNCAPGLYLVEVRSADSSQVFKILKQ